MQTKVFDMAGKQVGEIELSDAIFGIEPNEAVVHDVVKNHLANCRQGTQSSLTRAEVSGGGIKPWCNIFWNRESVMERYSIPVTLPPHQRKIL